MTMRESCAVEYAFDTRITPLSAATTLSGSARHEYSAITVYIPETASRTFLSSFLEFTTRDNFTLAADLSYIRLGAKVGYSGGVDIQRFNAAHAGWGGASSVQTFSGDGYIEATLGSSSSSVAFGLSTSDPNTDYVTIQYAIAFPGDNTYVVTESNNPRVTATAAAGDVFRIKRVGTTITYYKNGVLVYTSSLSVGLPLLIDVSINNNETIGTVNRLANLRYFPNGTETATTWTNVDSVAIGLASGWVDNDLSLTSSDSSDHMADTWTYDITNIMNASYSGISVPVQAAIAVATSISGSVSNLTCKLVSTHSYDDSSQDTFVKTVRIPLQSHINTLYTTHVQAGTVSGTAGTDAPSNQIPALTYFLPEDGKVIRQAFLDLYSNEATALSTTSYTPYIKIDNGTEIPRATLAQTLGTNLPWRDIYLFDTTTYLPTTTHSLSARTSVNNRLAGFGGFLNVTYEYNKSLTVASGFVMCEAIVPLTVGDTDRIQANEEGTSISGVSGEDWLNARFDISESSPTISQSAAFLWLDVTSNGWLPKIWLGSQPERHWTGYASGQGQTPTVHRGDCNSGAWAVSQGTNALTVKSYANLSQRGNVCGYAVVNYISSVPADGPQVATMPRAYLIAPTDGIGALNRAIVDRPALFPISGTYKIIGLLGAISLRENSYVLGNLIARALPGEFMGGGWQPVTASLDITSGQTDMITRVGHMPMSRSFNSCNHETGKLDIEASRSWRVSGNNGSAESGVTTWATYNTIECTISGTVHGYTATGSGIEVDVFDPDNNYHTTVTTVSGGHYVAVVHDDRSGYWTAARQDSTHVGRSDDGVPVI